MKKTTSAGAIHRLTPREIMTASAGDLPDGGGLTLRVTDVSASWVLRFTSPAGKRREMGLGLCHRASLPQAGASLTGARNEAHKARELLRQGVDPISARDERREAARRAEEAAKAEQARQRWTLARAARDYHARIIEPSRTAKHAATWIASLEYHVPPNLWNAPIDAIEAPDLLSALLGIKPHERARAHKGDKLPETTQRIRQRLDAVFEDAIFHRRASVNPAAAVRRKMREAAPRRERGQYRALPYKEAPAFMQTLRAAEGVAARCLEFTILTAARTGESLLAEWPEFDLDAATWEIPAAKMKAKEAHTVFLSVRAVELLRSMQGIGTRYVFPSPMPGREDKPLSNMAMLVTLDRLGYRDRTTVHGLARATFSTWANETGAARPDVIEACLAHEEGNKVRAAYMRAKFNEERRAVLSAWADYLARPPAQVIELESKRA